MGTCGEVSGNLLCGHVRPLLNVRHFEDANAVPIAVLFLWTSGPGLSLLSFSRKALVRFDTAADNSGLRRTRRSQCTRGGHIKLEITNDVGFYAGLGGKVNKELFLILDLRNSLLLKYVFSTYL